MYNIKLRISMSTRFHRGTINFSKFRYYTTTCGFYIYIYLYMSLIKCSRKEGRLAGDIGLGFNSSSVVQGLLLRNYNGLDIRKLASAGH